MEQKVKIKGKNLILSGKLDHQGQTKGVVITHPHPLYGGSMENNVVEAVRRAFQSSGYATLRFNFRGVGESEGEFGEGIKETDDVRWALDFLKAQGVSFLALAGYSFGAWVNSRVPSHLDLAASLWVSPPIAFHQIPPDQVLIKPQWIVSGDRDQFCPMDLLEKFASALSPEPRVEILPGMDHFFGGGEDKLAARIRILIME